MLSYNHITYMILIQNTQVLVLGIDCDYIKTDKNSEKTFFKIINYNIYKFCLCIFFISISFI